MDQSYSSSLPVVAWLAAVALPTCALGRDDGQSHWAFQRPVAAPLPEVADPALRERITNPIDAFVFAKLEALGIDPSEEASKRTLIRRVTYDLTGLPPTFDEIERFVGDTAEDAYPKLVDSLLASPRYGERWGRHWLDVARYADTIGYAIGGREPRFPYSYTYRDWVINAINNDLRYDDFLRYQIAGDRFVEEEGAERAHLAALGFLTVGRQFLGREQDIIDDQIDVVTRGALGLTVSCARCHDHKFDPIPTADYYSLYGVFASSRVPDELPEIGGPGEGADYEAYVEGKSAIEGEIQHYLQSKRDAARSAEKLVEYFKAAEELWEADGKKIGEVVDRRSLYRRLAERWIAFLKSPPDGELAQVFAEWREASAPREDGAHRALAEKVVALLAEDSPVGRALNSPECPTGIAVDDYRGLLHRGDRNGLTELDAKLVKFVASSPGAPPRAMVMVDEDKPRDAPIFERGNPGSRGEIVPRQFLQVLSPGDAREPFTKGSGRRQLADAIADPANPLTARVAVDRTWMHHFGRPLVRTPGDFGVQCPEPVQHDLLDYLAVRFMDDGWSMKKLHRLMVLSATYRQSSAARPDLAQSDPENDLYARANRKRLGFEAMRDSVLSASGALDLTMGGKPVEIAAHPSPPRRTVYAFVDRQDLPPMFRAFDFASPDAHTPMRLETTVPQQALFVMNSPFVVEQAERIARGEALAATDDPAEKVRRLYRQVLARSPTTRELETALAFVRSESAGRPAQTPTRWEYGYGAWDDASAKLEFHRLPHWSGNTWQGGANLPDPSLGWVSLNDGGGHPGDASKAAIRRWTTERGGTFRITGKLRRNSEQGDGVRGRLVTDRQGVVGEWILEPVAGGAEVDAEVDAVSLEAGEAVSFVVDCRENPSHDSFSWAATIEEPGSDAGVVRSDEGFSGPAQLDVWDKLAQVLLATNEFAFID